MKNIGYINYTWKHKKAYLQIEKQLLGRNTFRGYIHDFDKILLYPFLEKVTVTKIHRKIAGHHLSKDKKHTKRDYVCAIIDWECCRYTKPDKPLTARETLYKLYPEFIEDIEPILDELGLYK